MLNGQVEIRVKDNGAYARPHPAHWPVDHIPYMNTSYYASSAVVAEDVGGPINFFSWKVTKIFPRTRCSLRVSR